MYDSATGLYYARARWYNPAVGQFTSQDPTGFAAGDANLYRYVGDNPATMTDPWGLSGGGGGNGTWDPGNVSPLMPMVAPDTPCDGPMVTEMGLNVPSPLMPMIAPDTPFEGPMVNYLDAYGSPWMPMHSPDEPFEGPMVNEIGASVPSPLMPMIAPDTPFEGPMVNEIGAGLPPQLMPMVAPDTPFEGPMVNEIGASTLYGGEMIPLLPPTPFILRATARRGAWAPTGTSATVFQLRLRFARRPTCWATASTREPISGPGTAAIASVNS